MLNFKFNHEKRCIELLNKYTNLIKKNYEVGGCGNALFIFQQWNLVQNQIARTA